VREHRIARLGRLCNGPREPALDVHTHRGGHPGVLPEHMRRIGEGRRIRDRRTRGNRREIVADHVRERERPERAGTPRSPCQAAALQARQMLADHVDGRDVRPGREQRGRGCLLVTEHQPRRGRGEQGRGAAAQKDEDRTSSIRGRRQLEEIGGGRLAAGVGQRMSGLDDGEPRQDARPAVRHDDDASRAGVAHDFRCRDRHRERGLPGGEDDHRIGDPPETRGRTRQPLPHEPRRLDRGERRAIARERVGARTGGVHRARRPLDLTEGRRL
jgi:hypothetical protein